MTIRMRLMIATGTVFLLLQLVRPSIPTTSATAEIQAPTEVRSILAKDCYSCHSDQRRLSWFDQVVPGYWLVRSDILIAREHLNFSTLGSKPAAAQRATLYEAVNMIQLGAMPPGNFTALHPDAKVTPGELALLKSYLAPWASLPPSSVRSNGATQVLPTRVELAEVKPEFNGLGFEAGFEGWKPISFTDRGDNNTFRFILDNAIALKAAQEGNIFPWPDGTSFAKIAWQQETGSDGLIHPGKFVQVELMVKGAHAYKQTEGWGWGRWRGMDLKPYGSDAHFVKECTTCHMPVRRNDDVHTLPITRAATRGQEVVNNRASALPEDLPYQPLAWGAITMYVDPIAHTMATLYGNDAAVQAARRSSKVSGLPATYPPGSILALVVWNQRADPHWFGGRIPDRPKSIEFVENPAQRTTSNYERFDGPGLTKQSMPLDLAAQRTSFISNLLPAILPRDLRKEQTP